MGTILAAGGQIFHVCDYGLKRSEDQLKRSVKIRILTFRMSYLKYLRITVAENNAWQ